MKLTQKNRRHAGWTLIEVLVIVAVVILLVSMIAPRLAAGRRRPARISCINNLRQIELALRTWAVDHDDKFPTQVSVTNGGTMELVANGLACVHFRAMSNELSVPKLLVCQEDTARNTAHSFGVGDLSDSNVSYFISVDTSDIHPQILLIGDRNLSLDNVPVKRGLISLTTNSRVGWTKEIHVDIGNIGLADGSVLQTSNDELQRALPNTGFVTNRLAIP